jgi:sugar diacid utilization regulator
MSTSLSALLGGPLGPDLHLRVMPDGAREITQVTLLEDFGRADALRPGALAVLSRIVADATSGYQLDVLVRQAAERGVAGLVLREASPRSLTAEALARRGGVALVEVDNDADPLQVMDRIGAAVHGSARAALARLAVAADHAVGESDDPAGLIATLEVLTGVPLTWLDGGVGAPIVVDGRPDGVVATTELGNAATVAVHLAAAALSRLLTAQHHETFRPVRSGSSALNELLLCAQANLATVAERAVGVGLDVHGWHCALRIALEAPGGDDMLARVEEELVAFVARRVREAGGTWTVARPDASIVLVRTTRNEPGPPEEALVRRFLDDALSAVTTQHPEAQVRAGVATPHRGASGLRTSAEEARIALAASRLSDVAVNVATFDSLGLQRMLAEWLVTDTARDTVRSLLAPLDALGAEKSRVAVETLHAYLDERGSLQRAAARLNLHRNAVVYRMAQISETLPNDLTDPNERFALQLACRARLMTLGRS